MGNMDIYNAVSTVPGSAQKRITGGRLNGMTDINPMWRIRELTKLFGPCGIGWKYKIVREWLETASTGEVGAFVDIELQYRITPDADWSEPIPGTGGSKFVAAESPSTRRAWIEMSSARSSYSGNCVALHPEGVDRNNNRRFLQWQKLKVALHPEGVDRNIVIVTIILITMLGVALHPEGVDRNYTISENGEQVFYGRPPPGGRG